MRRLDELIAEYCPNGVKHIELKNATIMQRGTSMTKAQSNDGIYPVISGGKEPAFYCDKYNRDGETITIAGSGAGAGFVQYWNGLIFVNDAFSVVGKTDVSTKYVYYCLNNIQEQIFGTKKGGGVPHVHIFDIENFKIPVPPLPVQREIVRILDNFTELTAELTAELQAELQARKKQYEYYRKVLIENSDDIQQYFLGELATIKTGSKPNDIFELPNKYEYINAGTTNSGYTSKANCEIDTVTTPSRGQGGIGFVGYQYNPFWLGPLCYRIKSRNDILVTNRYLFYYLSCFNEKILAYKKEGGTPSVNASDLVNIVVDVPPLKEQQRIVSILDRFDALCNDITTGLPAEIEAHQKLYEYYRDKLLTFKELA